MLVGGRRHDQAERLRRGHDHLAALAPALVAAEVERLSLIIGPPTVPPNCCWLYGAFTFSPFTTAQRRRGVQVARADHHEGRSGDIVGAALGDHARDASRMAAELGRELVGDELHFLDRLDGEAARPELRRALQRQPLRVVVRAVDVGAEVPHLLAADVHRVRARAGGDDVGVERQQPEVVALLDRQVLERRPIDRCSTPPPRWSARSAHRPRP